jgi:hypothetical protein
MIAYDLTCANGHTFEGWFEDLAAFESQKSKGLIACPTCNDTSVTVVPSTFGIKTNALMHQNTETGVSPQDGDQGRNLDQVMSFLNENFEDVGHEFAKEALKMHYDVSEKRNIRGSSTPSEEETLKKEGIKFFKLPVPTSDS